jgi:hypothetical protein
VTVVTDVRSIRRRFWTPVQCGCPTLPKEHNDLDGTRRSVLPRTEQAICGDRFSNVLKTENKNINATVNQQPHDTGPARKLNNSGCLWELDLGRLVAGGGFEPRTRIDNTQVIDFTYRKNSEKRTTRTGTGHRQDTDTCVFRFVCDAVIALSRSHGETNDR